MCAARRKFGAVSHQTDRPHLAVFILPSSVARPPSAQFPILKLTRALSGLRQNAIAIIAEDPRLMVMGHPDGGQFGVEDLQ